MSAANTFNVCLGHLPFPAQFCGHIDLMLAPQPVDCNCPVHVIDAGSFGEHGGALGDYAMLFWLLDHAGTMLSGYDYVRIFHYRRFAARSIGAGTRSTNHPWATTLKIPEVEGYAGEFDRACSAELFNTPTEFPDGIVGQYAAFHFIEDLLDFSKFVVAAGVLDRGQTANFLVEKTFIPVCNVGVFGISSFTDIFGKLRRAADFVNSSAFVPRSGYQRRNAAFLLERLNSFLILLRVRRGLSAPRFGCNVILSETPEVTASQ
jgi:hypothetical protein